jgi:hypothetical protein
MAAWKKDANGKNIPTGVKFKDETMEITFDKQVNFTSQERKSPEY